MDKIFIRAYREGNTGINMAQNSMYKYKRLLKNISMLLAGNFVAKVLSFFMVPFYTSILTTSDYGIADLISNIVFLVLPIFSILMEEAVMRFSLDKGNDSQEVFAIAFKLSTVGFFIALCISPILLLLENFRPYYGYVLLYYVVTWLYNLLSNYVKGLDKVILTATAGVIHTFAYLGLNIYFLAVLKIGVFGYLLAISLSNLLAILFLAGKSKALKVIFVSRETNWKLAKEMVKYSLPMIPNYILWWVNNASDRFLVTFFCGTAVNGVYAVAYKIPSLLNSLTSIFSSAWQISSVDNFGTKESINFYNKIYSFYSGMLLIGASGLILITKGIAQILFAKDFFEAWKITPILVLAYIFSALAQYLNSVFSASKKTKTLMYSSFAGAVVNIVLNMILIPKFGGSGAAIATFIGYMTIWIVNMKNTRKIIKMNLNLCNIVISTCLIIIEIISVLLNCKNGYVLASICMSGVLLMNRGAFVDILNMIKIRVKHL